MSGVLVDSSVLLDLIGPESAWHGWSRDTFTGLRETRDVWVNIVIWAEVSTAYRDANRMDFLASGQFVKRREIPWDAAEAAGRAHRNYRRRGGARTTILPDFLIGAHAVAEGLPLLTRDPYRVRAAFPDLQLITPN